MGVKLAEYWVLWQFMRIPSAFKISMPAGLIVAICSLLAFTASASAEIGDVVEDATTAATEVVEAPAATVEPEPAQAAPVASTPEPKPVTVPSVPSVSRVIPTEVKPVVRSVEGAAAAVQDNLAEGTRSLLRKTDEPLRGVTALAKGGLDSIESATGKATLPSVGSLSPEPRGVSTDRGPSADALLSSPLPPSLSPFTPLPVPGASQPQLPAGFGGVEAVATRSGALSQTGGRAESLPPLPLGNSGALFSTTSHDRSGSPNPVWVPPLAPNLPGAPIASGSGGSFFAPIAALLALLALVAPAVLRRLGEVPDCRPPTPFVCALERPG